MRKKLSLHDKYYDQEEIPNGSDYEKFDNEDGSVKLVHKDDLDDYEISADIHDHNANLAEIIDESILNKISGSLVDAVESDEESRANWNSRMAEGFSLLGLKPEASKQNSFKHFTRVHSPIILQCLVEFNNSAKIELFPPTGPIKCNIYSDEDEELIERAKRKERFGNYYLLEEDKGYYPDCEQALMWMAYFGSVFKKVFFDPITQKPLSRYIEPENLIINNRASSPEDAERITEVTYPKSYEVLIYQEKGFFRKDINIIELTEADETSKVQKALGDIEGQDKSITSDTNNLDKTYKIYNINTKLDLESFGFHDPYARKNIPSPYIVVIEAKGENIVGLFRNWREGDRTYKAKNQFIHMYYTPGFGLYGFGLIHLAGNNAKAATEILRLLINSAILANHPGGVIAGALKSEKSEIMIGPMEFHRIDTTGIDDITKAIMPLPYKDPSPVLKELKDDIEENIANINAAANKIPEFNTQAAPGTTFALLEESKRQQTAIIQRLHYAMSNEFTLLFDLFGEYMADEKYPFYMEGTEHIVLADDFKDNKDLVPVSDPNIISSAQRLMREQIIMNTASEHSDIINIRYALERYFRSIKLDTNTIERLIPPEEEILPLDPITEIQNAINGKAIKAAIWQDHEAHIICKQAEIQNLMNSQDPNQNAISILQANIREHDAFAYQIHMQQAMGKKLPDDPSKLSPKMQNNIAMRAAQAVQEQLQQQSQMQQAQQPIDPSQVMLEDLQIKRESNMMRQQENAEKMQFEQIKLQHEKEMKLLELQFKADAADKADQSKLTIEQMSQAFQEQMAQLRNEFELYKLEQQQAIDMEKAHLQSETSIELKHMDIDKENISNVEHADQPL